MTTTLSERPSAPAPLRYGPALSLDAAKRVMVAAEAEAERQGWPMVIAIVDGGGHLVMLHRRDDAQHGSVAVACRKAESAVAFKRSTKVMEETLVAGGPGLRLLALDGLMPVEGGLPLLVDGRIAGAIGVSGMQSTEDAQVAAAGASALA